MKCPKCGTDMLWDGAVCTTLPPKYMHKCILCGHVEYLDSPDVVEEEPRIPFDYDDINKEGTAQEYAKMSREVMYEAFRAKAAMLMMHCIVSKKYSTDNSRDMIRDYAKKAVEYANALIEELKK